MWHVLVFSMRNIQLADRFIWHFVCVCTIFKLNIFGAFFLKRNNNSSFDHRPFKTNRCETTTATRKKTRKRIPSEMRNALHIFQTHNSKLHNNIDSSNVTYAAHFTIICRISNWILKYKSSPWLHYTKWARQFCFVCTIFVCCMENGSKTFSNANKLFIHCYLCINETERAASRWSITKN